MPRKSLLRFYAFSAFSSLAILLCLSVWPGRALSADQTIAGKSFSVRDRSGGSDAGARRVGVTAVERGSSHTIVGDPAARRGDAGDHRERDERDQPERSTCRRRSGATTRGPLATRFTYRDPKGTNGAVTKAHIRRSRGGKFSIRAVDRRVRRIASSLWTWCRPTTARTRYALLTIGGGGDRYCVQYGADGRVRNRGAVSFRVDEADVGGLPGAGRPVRCRSVVGVE